MRKASKITKGQDARKQWPDELKAMVIQDLAAMQAANEKKPREKVASKHNVPLGNIARWVKAKDKILQSAGATVAQKLLSLQCRRTSMKSVQGRQHVRLRLWNDDQKDMLNLRQYVLEEIKIRQLARRGVSIKFVKRVTKRRLGQLKDLGMEIKKRGKPFEASDHWCFDLLAMSGNVSKRRGCKKSTPPEKMAQSISNFAHFVRTHVIHKAGFEQKNGSSE